jgi:hypothetical protein
MSNAPDGRLLPITCSVAQVQELTGLNERKVRQLLADGSVDSVRIGKRRFVFIASIHAYFEHLRDEQTNFVRR